MAYEKEVDYNSVIPFRDSIFVTNDEVVTTCIILTQSCRFLCVGTKLYNGFL